MTRVMPVCFRLFFQDSLARFDFVAVPCVGSLDAPSPGKCTYQMTPASEIELHQINLALRLYTWCECKSE